MATVVNFTPSATTLFQFVAQLDGASYNVLVTWSLSGQRWYLNVYTLQGKLVLTRAMVGSPGDYDINLVKGYFASSLVYRVGNQQFEVSP